MIEYPTDEGVISAFASMQGLPDFTRFLQWLKNERDELAIRGMRAKLDDVQMTQGAFLALEELVRIIEDSRNVLQSRQVRRSKVKTRIP
jgi:hypothetical protein